MKKLLLIAALLLAITAAEAKKRTIKQFFTECKTDYNLKQIKIGRFVFWMINKLSDLEPSEKAVISSIRQIRVFTHDEEKGIDTDVREKFLKYFRTTMQQENFELQLEVRDNESEIYWLPDKKYGHLFVVDKEEADIEFVYLKIKGDAWEKIVESDFISQMKDDNT